MPNSGPLLSLVIPALNESGIILENCLELKAWMKANLPAVSFEIVVVNDGSTDGMGEILEKQNQKDPTIRVVHHSENLGRGRAVRTGMEHTRSQYLIALDSDLSYDPKHIKGLLEPLMKNQADLTVASPYHPQGTVKNVPYFRAWLSKWGNRILSRSFQTKIYTSTCVVRGYTRQLIDHLELVNDGKDFHLEVISKTETLGFRILEIPSELNWRDRKRGKPQKGQGNLITNNTLIKMRKAIFTHFVFNFFSKPKILFLGPIAFLLALIAYGACTIMWVYFSNLAEGIPTPLRTTLIQGKLTLGLTISSFALLFAFTFFLFLASQAKKYFEESFILMSRMNYRLKQQQKSLLDKE